MPFSTWRIFEAMTAREFQRRLTIVVWTRFLIGIGLGLAAGWWLRGWLS